MLEQEPDRPLGVLSTPIAGTCADRAERMLGLRRLNLPKGG
jgi:hypothetical protein